jgi:hypothetical protein
VLEVQFRNENLRLSTSQDLQGTESISRRQYFIAAAAKHLRASLGKLTISVYNRMRRRNRASASIWLVIITLLRAIVVFRRFWVFAMGEELKWASAVQCGLYI